jgi:hypothetical protein
MWSPFVIDHLFSHGTLVSTTNKTDRHDVIEIYDKWSLNTGLIDMKCTVKGNEN